MVTKAKISTNPLASSAMLVCLQIHQWGYRRLDPGVSNKAAAELGAGQEMLRTWKRLLGRDSTKIVSVAFSRYKSHHYENTVPWLDNGYRMLPSANYLPYVEKERELRADCDRAVEDFLKFYPKHREAAQARLGRAFNENDYPTAQAVRRKFSIDLHFMPIPDKADFRVDVPAKELTRINADIDGQVKLALENATRDLFERLYEVVISLRDRLKAHKTPSVGKDAKRQRSFRDSAVSNVVDICKLLPRLNINGNPELKKLTDDVMKSLGKADPEALRENDDLRATAIKKADDILARMADYVTG